MPIARRPTHLAALALGAALFGSVSARGQVEPPAALGPLDLFNGKDLSGWKPVNARGNFLVRDGLLVMNGGAGWLASEKTYGDFQLRLVYRFVTPGADSGVFIRSGLAGKNWTESGYQVQNMDNATLGKVIGMGKRVEGPLHSEAETKLGLRPSGGWNEMVILAKGPDVVVTLNGKPISSARIAPEAGHVGLQAEGGVLEFREIEIEPL